MQRGTQYGRPAKNIQRWYVVLAAIGERDIAFVNRFKDSNEAHRLLGQLVRGYRKKGLRVFVTEQPQATTITWSELRAKLRVETLPMTARAIKDFHAPLPPAVDYSDIPPWEDLPTINTS